MAIREIKAFGKTYKISYEIKNPKFNNYILILHGWGANKELMIKAFEKHFDNIKQIYVDLPGFGGSNMFDPLNTKKYAFIIKEFIKTMPNEPHIIMGHSFGGKVATLLKPKNLVLLSTAGIVEEKPFIVRAKIKTFKAFKKAGFGSLYKLFATKDVEGMSREMYETLKNVVDEDFREIFAKTTSKTLIFWGEGDKAVSVKSGELINRLIKGSEFYPLSGDHFFFLLHSKFIAQTVSAKFVDDSSEVVDNSLDEISDVIELDSDSGIEGIFERDSLDKSSKKSKAIIESLKSSFKEEKNLEKNPYKTEEEVKKTVESGFFGGVSDVFEREYSPKDAGLETEPEIIEGEADSEINIEILETKKIETEKNTVEEPKIENFYGNVSEVIERDYKEEEEIIENIEEEISENVEVEILEEAVLENEIENEEDRVLELFGDEVGEVVEIYSSENLENIEEIKEPEKQEFNNFYGNVSEVVERDYQPKETLNLENIEDKKDNKELKTIKTKLDIKPAEPKIDNFYGNVSDVIERDYKPKEPVLKDIKSADEILETDLKEEIIEISEQKEEFESFGSDVSEAIEREYKEEEILEKDELDSEILEIAESKTESLEKLEDELEIIEPQMELFYSNVSEAVEREYKEEIAISDETEEASIETKTETVETKAVEPKKETQNKKEEIFDNEEFKTKTDIKTYLDNQEVSEVFEDEILKTQEAIKAETPVETPKKEPVKRFSDIYIERIKRAIEKMEREER